METQRVGAVSVQEMIFILVVLALMVVVSVTTLSGSGWRGAILSGLTDGWQTMDKARLTGSVTTMTGTGTATTSVNVEIEYEEISVSGNRLVLSTADGETRVNLPPGFDYSGSASDVSEVCVIKDGLSITFGEGPCTGDDLPTCSGGCSAVYRSRDAGSSVPNPEYGYVCRNGVYDDTEFYTEYYQREDSSCGDVSGGFAAINSFACPDLHEEGDSVTCQVEATWRCDSGSLDWEISGPQGSQSGSGSCTGEVEHAAFTASLNLPARTTSQQQFDLAATVSGGGDARTAERTMRYSSRERYRGRRYP